MYCESKVSHIDFAHVEHIKPKAWDKFPELEFIWDNLGYACAKCNNEKSDKYFDDAPFINPYAEEPSEFVFFFGPLMFHRNGGERGEISVKEINLNRPELIERRMKKMKKLNNHQLKLVG